MIIETLLLHADELCCSAVQGPPPAVYGVYVGARDRIRYYRLLSVYGDPPIAVYWLGEEKLPED